MASCEACDGTRQEGCLGKGGFTHSLRQLADCVPLILRIIANPESQVAYLRFTALEGEREMMHDRLFYALLPMILWLFVILLWVWPWREALTSPADRQPAKRATKRSQAHKPIPGLTHKPPCAAWSIASWRC
jgi:hypothetical protein